MQTAFAERLPIDYLAARSVDEDAAGLHSLEELRPGHVPGRIVQRSVEGEDVGLARHLFERQESAVLALFAGGIACHDAGIPTSGRRPRRATRRVLHRRFRGFCLQVPRPVLVRGGPVLQRRIAVRPVHCILRRSLLRCRVADNTPCRCGRSRWSPLRSV